MDEIINSILSGTPVTLNTNHVRVLKTLRRARGPITRQTIAERIQSVEDVKFTDNRIPNESETYRFLTTAGLVRYEELDEDGTKLHVYTITAKGREMLAKE